MHDTASRSSALQANLSDNETQKFIAKLFPRATVSPFTPHMRTAGIHHITAIASDPLRTLTFYSRVLGLRLVKRTVNFDDPGSYHFYFGDNLGTPGSIITFFLWPGAARGKRGSGQVVAVSFAIGKNSFDFWKTRLREHHVHVEEIDAKFGERGLRFLDPDGLLLQLVIASEVEGSHDRNLEVTLRDSSTSLRFGRDDGAFSGEHAIRGFAAPTLHVSDAELTEKLLTKILGFQLLTEEGKYRRFVGSENFAASRIDVDFSEAAPGRIAVGSAHHIAFRAPNDEKQLQWREQLSRAGFAVSPVMDRNYFHSIYFREPSGILFEIATDGPGFAIDEAPEALGQSLKLPPAYEPMRAEIERMLPPLETAVTV
jgi:glyoxalase family protein